MDTVPLELQRKCEQRWAARYRRPLEPSATLDHRLDGNACADVISSISVQDAVQDDAGILLALGISELPGLRKS
jgi:hypothetical protein